MALDPSHRLAAPTVAIVTLGCKLNQADSDRLTEAFQARGFQPVAEDQPADAVVVNTCTVTHVADRKSRQLLRRARRLNRQAVVAAVGCYPAVAPDDLRAMPEVDVVLGTRDKLAVVEQVARRLARPAGTALDAPALVPARALTRAMVKIEEGCDARCTFCIIPRARGDLTSLSVDDIVAEVGRLAVDHYEVVLTGTNVGRYGYEIDRVRRLPELLRRVLDETPVRRLRLTSIEPSDLTPALLALWRDEPRLARHFHLALQAGSDPVLRAMRRRYNTAQFARAVARLRAVVPEAAITTDIIAGFPGETEADHAATLAFARGIGFSRIHVFPYSPRRGTSAATMADHVPDPVRDRRCADLRALGAEGAAAYARRWLGQTVTVLWEERGGQEARRPGDGGGTGDGGEPGDGGRPGGTGGREGQVGDLVGAQHAAPAWPPSDPRPMPPMFRELQVLPVTPLITGDGSARPSERSTLRPYPSAPTPSIPPRIPVPPSPPGTPVPPSLLASWSGHTDTYLRVVAAAPAGWDLAGQVTPVRLTALVDDGVTGDLLAREDEPWR